MKNICENCRYKKTSTKKSYRVGVSMRQIRTWRIRLNDAYKPYIRQSAPCAFEGMTHIRVNPRQRCYYATSINESRNRRISLAILLLLMTHRTLPAQSN